jgi:DNA-binding response OmpR family regulator/DNA-binding CsgD family transcriptional regulator
VNPPTEALQRDVVLVVDDTPDTLSLLTYALEAAGMTVLVATDGATALERVRVVTPDVILLDAVMPGMDGFETCAALRRVDAIREVPIIFMTGLSDSDSVLRGFQSGGVDYVTKPIDPVTLIARIRSHLTKARLMASTRAALDVSGRALVAVSSDGLVRWSTTRAEGLLSDVVERQAGQGDRLKAPLLRWLLESARPGQAADAEGRGEQPVSLTFVGRLGAGELLLALEQRAAVPDNSALAARFGLTEREAEVLMWVARGKSSRDIGEILGSSPRTVDKHLERIFVKLGVESRAAATAVALRFLAANPERNDGS